MKPPTTSQTEPAPASEQNSAAKPSEASERTASEESVTTIQTARGESADADSETSANADGESNPPSANKKSSKPEKGESTAQEGSGSGSGEGGRSGGSSAGGKSKPSGQTGKPSSPGEAVATAQTLKRRSDKAAAGKEYGQAFELATQAWESVQTFPKDAACREMSNELQGRMEELGTLANAQRGSDLKRDKPLIVR